jgi:hypothetical protein
MRIDHRVTSAHCPQSDGLAERAVQTVKQALRKHLIVDPQQDWDTKLPWIALAYNCSIQEATRLTPYEVVFARKAIIPPAAASEFANPLPAVTTPEDLARLCSQRAHAAMQASIIAGENIKIAQHRVRAFGEEATHPSCWSSRRGTLYTCSIPAACMGSSPALSPRYTR